VRLSKKRALLLFTVFVTKTWEKAQLFHAGMFAKISNAQKHPLTYFEVCLWWSHVVKCLSGLLM